MAGTESLLDTGNGSGLFQIPVQPQAGTVAPSNQQISATEGANQVAGGANNSPASADLTAQPTLNPNGSPYTPLSLPQAQGRNIGAALQPDQQPQQLGAVNGAGAGAYIADRLLRGAITGMDAANARKTQMYNAKLTAQQAVYNDQASQFYKLAQAGVDPSSQEFIDAKDRTLASWQSMMQTMGERVPPPARQKGGKGGSSSAPPSNPADTSDPNSIVSRIANHQQNPQDALAAIYQASVAAGPPVFHQAMPLLSQAARAKQQQAAGTASDTAAAQGSTADFSAQNSAMQAEFAHLSNIPEDQQTEQQKQRIEQIRDYLNNQPGGKLNPNNTWKPNGQPYPDGKGGWQLREVNGRGAVRETSLPDYMGPAALALKGIPKTGQDQHTGLWMTWQEDTKGKVIPETLKPLNSQATAPDTTRSSEREVFDPVTGQKALLNSSEQTHHQGVGTTGMVAGAATTPNAASVAAAGSTPALVSETPPGITPAQHVATPAHVAPASVGTGAAPGGGTGGSPRSGSSSVNNGAGYEQTMTPKLQPYQQKVVEDANTATTNYTNAVHWAKSGTPTDQMNIIMAYTRSQVAGAGRMTETEIKRNISAGSYGQRLQSAWDQAIHGTYDPDYMLNLLNTMRTDWQTKQKVMQQTLQHPVRPGNVATVPGVVPQQPATAAAPAPVAPGPASHVFSKSGWLAKNPHGNVDAAVSLANSQGYRVVD